jgi:hypothetical protein
MILDIIKLLKSPRFHLLMLLLSVALFFQKRADYVFIAEYEYKEVISEIATKSESDFNNKLSNLGISYLSYYTGGLNREEFFKIVEEYHTNPLIYQLIKKYPVDSDGDFTYDNLININNLLFVIIGGFIMSLIIVIIPSTISYLSKSWTLEGTMQAFTKLWIIIFLLGLISKIFGYK